MHTCALCVCFVLIDVVGKHNFCVFDLNSKFSNSRLFTGVSRSYIIIQNNNFAIFQQYVLDYSFIIYSSLLERVLMIPILTINAANNYEHLQYIRTSNSVSSLNVLSEGFKMCNYVTLPHL